MIQNASFILEFNTSLEVPRCGQSSLIPLSGDKLWAIEIKRSSSPKVERGFHVACEDLKPQKRFVAYPGIDRFPIASETEAIGVAALARALQAEGNSEFSPPWRVA